MGLAGLWELFKNSNGIQIMQERTQTVFQFGRSQMEVLGERIEYSGGIPLSPLTTSCNPQAHPL